MAKYTRTQIMDRAQELAKMISDTEEVDFFKRAEAQLNENQKVSALISKIKTLQKQAVNLQHYQKHEALKQVEEEIDNLYAQLDEIPIIKEFQQSQADVNDLLQIVATTISNRVTDYVIESTGGNILHGETGSKAKNSGSSCDH
ncbi:RicAFT regulatory complex protein RicA family protein [Bacillus marinisedimentorum]|uniref:RicAFT regulatory complex protein RicA family protein n=1 Tax=Bacillus marinisedimentorum TaxID=1821260 RepID=UPI0007DF21BB|nr:RicAFT regulatory complex protein RicA family protein [Bacillus marinisedimentorum]